MRLRDALEEYLKVRRALGFKLTNAGWFAPEVRHLCGAGGRFFDHHRAGVTVGHGANEAVSRPNGRTGSRWCGGSPAT